MEIRLTREVEKSKSVLYKTRTTGPSTMGYGTGADSTDYRDKASYRPDETDAVIEQQLDAEQLQLFAQENQDMLKQYEDQLDKVRYVAGHVAGPTAANGHTAPRKNHSPRSRSCSRRSPATSACRRRTLTSWSRTRSTLGTMSGAATRSSSGRRSAAARRKRCFGRRASSARGWCCGTCLCEGVMVMMMMMMLWWWCIETPNR